MAIETELPLLSTAVADTPAAGGSDTTQAEPKTTVEPVKGNEVKAEEPKTDVKAEQKEGEQKQETVVPGEYKFKLPEGEKVDQVRLAEVSGVFKQLKLTQEQAQGLMDYNLKLSKEGQDANLKAFEDSRNAWMEETRKELGAEAQTRMAFAAKARDAFGSKELIQLLVDSGLEKNIHVIKYFERVGKAISEDSLVEGKPTKGNDLSRLSPSERLEHHIQQAQDQVGKSKT